MNKKFVGINPKLIRPLTDEEQEKRGWKIQVNGVLVRDVSSVRLFNEKMGLEFRYGMRAEGYDGVVLHEPGGGGSVLVPFVTFDNTLHIGMLEQERKTQGGNALNLPRGFLDPGESHFETAAREMQEETGVAIDRSRIKDFNKYARSGNANSAFFGTSRDDEGVHFYGVEFLSQEVEEEPLPSLALRLRDDTIRPKEGNQMAERIFSCRFYPWRIAAGVGDLFTNAGLARLFKYVLDTEGEKGEKRIKIR